MVWKGFLAFPAHLRMRPVSRGNSRHPGGAALLARGGKPGGRWLSPAPLGPQPRSLGGAGGPTEKLSVPPCHPPLLGTLSGLRPHQQEPRVQNRRPLHSRQGGAGRGLRVHVLDHWARVLVQLQLCFWACSFVAAMPLSLCLFSPALQGAPRGWDETTPEQGQPASRAPECPQVFSHQTREGLSSPSFASAMTTFLRAGMEVFQGELSPPAPPTPCPLLSCPCLRQCWQGPGTFRTCPVSLGQP